MDQTTVGEVMAAMDEAYPPHLAEDWDSVGLVCGDPSEPVSTVMFAVDATARVVDEALSRGADMLIVHHPLLLRGVDTVGAHTPKGSLVQKLIRGHCALFTAHTNADSALPGVSDALAEALGLVDLRPLQEKSLAPIDKWVVFVPVADAAAVREAMFAAGGGEIGEYRECSWSASGLGQFRPVGDARPVIGTVGTVETVDETRLEMVARRGVRSAMLDAVRISHPYEEPAFDVLEMASLPSRRGLGRVGRLETPTTLGEFTKAVQDALPTTVWGVRAAGDPDGSISTVAVSGGAGDSLLGAATAAGVDVFVTSDLRHHVVDEHLRAGGPAVIDVAHWAGEFPWCGQAKEVLDRRFGSRPGWSATVSEERTDPWTCGGFATRA